MSSRRSLRAGALAALVLTAAGVQAASVTCQSRNNQREDCWLRGRGEVVLVRQISNTKCVKGRNWDETRNGLYVNSGCGGVFETRDGWNDRPDDRPGPGGGWVGRPGDRPDRPHPPDRPDRPDRPGDRPGERPVNPGRLPAGAIEACIQAADLGRDAQVERQEWTRNGQWRLTLKYPTNRQLCIIGPGGAVLSSSLMG